ncbi:hypothetical protein FJR48_06475 [Sulfurimonas lithotrophica]|uniref:Uncharacterized protein n=1 Tax=Sulfurimonas lithotrophica TaxID=2590022 RepID=A0A5P8P0Z4_9BACT|nr:hypothetical protein [Sulfurimonas lithotrophica]QFR49388.1 hypothetical protein FJR48_06475 [Sulfurimonas lithotrophica]
MRSKKLISVISLVFILNHQLYAKEYSKEELAEWNKIGVVKKYNIDKWKKLGVQTPQEAELWLKGGYTEKNYLDMWINIGAKTPEDVQRYKDAGVDLAEHSVDFAKANITSLEEIKKWLALGIDTYYIKDWKKANIPAEDVKAWINAGIEQPSDAQYWLDVNVKTPNEIKQWKEIGVLYSDNVERWQRIGLSSPSEVQGWINIDSPENIKKNWLDMGVKTPQEAQKWIDIGIKDSYSFQQWRSAGITEYKDIKMWLSSGLKNPKKISEWNKIGIKKPEHIRKWTTIGLTDPNIVEQLLDMGINDTKEYSPYKNMSYIGHIKMLKEMGITPTPLIEKMSKNYQIYGEILFFKSKEKFLKNLSILKSNGCKTIQGDWFGKADPYENEDLCYIFTAKLSQRLSKDEGLARSTAGKTIHLEFDGAWKENTTKLGIAKGSGSFSYKNGFGAKRIVPSGKVLLTTD